MIQKLKAEFVNGRTMFDWLFLSIGLLLQVFAIFYGYITGSPDNIASIVSGLTGIVSVVLCAQGKISFYIFGYVQLFTYVFGVAIPYALWGEAIENVFYFVTMLYGTYVWFKNYHTNDDGSSEIKAKKMNGGGWVLCITSLVVGTLLFALVLENIHAWLPAIFAEKDPSPYIDSFTTIAPFVAQILLMLGYREQWWFWIIEDIASVIMFVSLGSWVMVAQYLFWTANCIYGIILWSRNNKKLENEKTCNAK